MKKLAAVVLLTLFSILTFGQEKPRSPKPKHHFLTAKYSYGTVFQTNATVKGQNTSGEAITQYHSTALEFGKQTDGTRLWERLYNFPRFGAGYYSLFMVTDAEDFGAPNAFYGFITAPFTRWGDKWAFNYDIGFGLSYNWNPFNADVNALQTAIGSHRNVYIALGTSIDWYMSKRWTANVGTGFTHFSNGASTVPNRGINLGGLNLSLSYNLNADRAKEFTFDKGEIPTYEKENEFYTVFAFGSRNVKATREVSEGVTESIDEVYPMATVQFFYQKQISWKSKFGVGLDVMYDGSLAADAELVDDVWVGDISYSTLDGMSVGIAAQYELVISDLSIIASPAYEFWRRETPGRPGQFYQRAGVKYHLSDHLIAGINIHAIEFSIARYIEWNIGYRIKWKAGQKD